MLLVQAAFIIFLQPADTASPVVQILPSDMRWTPDGMYTASAALTAAGPATVAVQYDFQHLPGSPFTMEVLPAPTSAARCQVSGSGLQTLVAGSPAEVVVHAHDAWGNQATSTTDRPAHALRACITSLLPRASNPGCIEISSKPEAAQGQRLHAVTPKPYNAKSANLTRRVFGGRFWLLCNDSQAAGTNLIPFENSGPGEYAATYAVSTAGNASVTVTVLLDNSQVISTAQNACTDALLQASILWQYRQ